MAHDCLNGKVGGKVCDASSGQCPAEESDCQQLSQDIKQIADYAQSEELKISDTCDDTSNYSDEIKAFVEGLKTTYGLSACDTLLQNIVAKGADSKYADLFYKNDKAGEADYPLISCSAIGQPLCLDSTGEKDSGLGAGIDEAFSCVAGPKSCKVWNWVVGKDQPCKVTNPNGPASDSVCAYSKTSGSTPAPQNICYGGSDNTVKQCSPIGDFKCDKSDPNNGKVIMYCPGRKRYYERKRLLRKHIKR